MAIYMQYGAKDEIKGRVTAKGHENWIELRSLSVGAMRSIPMQTGSKTEREASAPALTEVVMTKVMDDGSPHLFQESLVGEGKTVTIHVSKTGANQLENIVEYVFTAGMITSYQASTGGDAPVETLSFSYTKIEMKYIQWDQAHKKSSQIPAGYDLALATKI